MNELNLNSERSKILNISKKYIVKHGWNEKSFLQVCYHSTFTKEEIISLFPDKHISLLEFYLDSLNSQMTELSKNLDLVNLKTHQKIRELILLRLRKNQNEKELIERTFFTLLLPNNALISTKSLYKTVDQIWFLAKDKSTDFNFYTKRAILAAVYSTTLFYWLKNDNMDKVELFLDKQLKKVSKIPQIKEKFKNFSSVFTRNFSKLSNNL